MTAERAPRQQELRNLRDLINFSRGLPLRYAVREYLLEMSTVDTVEGARGRVIRFAKVHGENICKCIEVEGFVTNINEKTLLLQKVPSVKCITKLDAPLHVPPGWFASWPLRCALGNGVTKPKLGSHLKTIGKLTVELDGEEDPALSPGFLYLLELNPPKSPLGGISEKVTTGDIQGGVSQGKIVRGVQIQEKITTWDISTRRGKLTEAGK